MVFVQARADLACMPEPVAVVECQARLSKLLTSVMDKFISLAKHGADFDPEEPNIANYLLDLVHATLPGILKQMQQLIKSDLSFCNTGHAKQPPQYMCVISPLCDASSWTLSFLQSKES